jgi:phage-related protein
MAATSRALTLKLLADVDSFTKNLNKADNDVKGFGDKVGAFGKKAALAFAAAGAAAAAYAGKLLVDGVKAAIEDEAAQAKLAKTLSNVTGATEKQIAAVESQILKTSLLTGVTDDELRPSFERFLRATGDSDKALQLQTTALDVAAGSGKSLEAVTNAMAKAQEGNTASLVKLGVGLTAAELKTMSMEEITAKLAETFGGQASEQADTFQGKMQRLNVAFAEGKETVGAFVLDAITPMVTNFVNDVIPAVQKLAEELGPKLTPVFTALTDYIRDYVVPTLRSMWSFITEFVIPAISAFLTPVIDGLRSAFEKVTTKLQENEEKLKPLVALFKTVAAFVRDYLAPVIGTQLKFAFDTLGTALGIIIDTFATLVDTVNKAYNAIKKLADFIKDNPSVLSGPTGIAGFGLQKLFGGGRAMGGPVSSGTTYMVGERGPELFTPNTNGTIIPNNRLGGASAGGTVINLTVNGAIDSESTARQIVTILNNSAARGTLGAGAFARP